MKNFEVKNISGGVKDVDTASRRVKIAISQVGTKDLDGDVIDPGAYTKTIAERGPKGANLIWHLTDHMPSLKSAVGKFSELYLDGNYLTGITDIPNTQWGNDVLEFYKAGAINQHSIGFRTIKQEPVNAGTPEEYNLIKEVLLYEGSSVLWGANPNTPTLSVGKSMTIEEVKTSYKDTLDELGRLHKMFKVGQLTDDSYELIEMKISQLTSKLQQLFEKATLPAVKAVEPDENDLLSALKAFTNNLKRKNDYGNDGDQKAA